MDPNHRITNLSRLGAYRVFAKMLLVAAVAHNVSESAGIA